MESSILSSSLTLHLPSSSSNSPFAFSTISSGFSFLHRKRTSPRTSPKKLKLKSIKNQITPLRISLNSTPNFSDPAIQVKPKQELPFSNFFFEIRKPVALVLFCIAIGFIPNQMLQRPAVAAPSISALFSRFKTSRKKSLNEKAHEFSGYTDRLLEEVSVLLERIVEVRAFKGSKDDPRVGELLKAVKEGLKSVKKRRKELQDEVLGVLNSELREMRRDKSKLDKESENLIDVFLNAKREREDLMKNVSGDGRAKTRIEELGNEMNSADSKYNEIWEKISEIEDNMLRKESMTYNVAIRELLFIERECEVLVEKFNFEWKIQSFEGTTQALSLAAPAFTSGFRAAPNLSRSLNHSGFLRVPVKKGTKPMNPTSYSRFHGLVPVAAATEDGKDPNGSVSSSTLDDEENSSLGSGYRLPPPEIRNIVDAPPLPALSFSPQRDKILFLKRRSLPPLTELARPEEKLAGVRIDGNCNTRSRMSFYTGIGIHTLMNDGTLGPEKEVYGFPDGAKINFVSWSHDGRHLSFSIRLDEEDNNSSKLKVWVANVETGKARPLFQSPDINLNAIFDNFVWVDDSTLLVCTIPCSRGAPPKKPLVPSGPKIQSNEQKNVVQVRTFQDLLKDEYDEDLFDYYATTQLVLASLGGTMKEIGPPAVYTSMDPSPDQKYILISSIHKPYSFIVPCGRFPKKVDLWTRDGKFVREICDLPLAEDIPIAFNSVRRGPRSINWRPDKPSMLYWVETQDGGDAKVEVSPRDIVYTQSAEPPDGEKPEVLHRLDLRYGGVSWADDSLALVYESWYKTRRTRTWVISPGSKEVSPRILFDRSSEDVYSDPGSPMLRRTSAGTYVIAKIKKDDAGTYILLNGSGATPEGNIPFLDLFDINTGAKERIWESDKEKYYETVVALMSDKEDSDLCLDQLKVLVSKESKTENTQYYIQSWPDKRVSQITKFPHPYPQLASLQKEMIRYQRKDGVQLTATLYLPPSYDPSKDGPLPCLVWSYPGEFKSKDAAGQVRGSPNEFAGIGSTSALLWLARGFAILSGPTIPIIGEGDEEANDRYVEQLVASAEAAVDEVIRRGVAHPNKIAVGGHSYGAFMAANLLAHAPHLFCCGIARSGAYNRTLTPFGFQNEDRTLWEATNIYVEMSPFISANKIKKPILLIHGEEDNNPGTLTMQSDRFFNALKGHGALCRLVVLPFESHGYAARESIMHVLWETDRWLQQHCVNNPDIVPNIDANKVDGSANVNDADDKALSASGGGGPENEGLECNGFHVAPRSSL